MSDIITPDQIDPKFRELGPKPGQTGFPSSELIEHVLDTAARLLFIQNLDDLLEEIGKNVIHLFPIKSIIIWICEKETNVRHPRIALGFDEETKNELLSISYTDEEIEYVRSLSNNFSRLSYFMPGELQYSLFGIDERDKLFGIDKEKASKPRESPGSWHELDYLNISFLARDGRYIGSIEIEDTTDSKIPSLETVKAIEIFSSLSSVAIELAELREKDQIITSAAEMRSARFSGILAFAKEMLSIRDPDAIFNEVLTVLRDLFGFTASSIILFNERENCYRYAAISGYRPDEIRYAKNISLPSDIMQTDGLPKYLVAPDTYFIPGEELSDEWLDYELRGDGEEERELLSRQRDQPRKHPKAWHPLDNLIYHVRDRKGHLVGLVYPDFPKDGLIPSPETIESVGIFIYLLSIALENAKNYAETVQVKEEIELLNKLLFQDVSNHNLAIRRFLEMAMEDDISTNRASKLLQSATSELNRTVNLIKKVRNLSAIRSRDKSSLLRLDLVSAVRNQIPQSIGKFPNRNITVNYAKMPDECFVFANELVGELFDNLISNAIIHNPKGEAEINISIDSRHDDLSGRNFWVVSIADNGPGIPDDLKRVIFDILSQFGSIEGKTGLGLVIVRSLISYFGGSIWVDDRVKGDHSKGCVFSFILPAA